MTDEVQLVGDLARLLSDEAHRTEVVELWSIGENEGALNALVSHLLAGPTPIDGDVRAVIAVLADEWGVLSALDGDLRRIPGAAGDEARVRLLYPTEPVPAGTVHADPRLAGLPAVPWLDCPRCGAVLHRVHGPEPYALHLAPVHLLLAQDGAATLFEPDAVWDALDTLLDCPES